jgi:hypothetical protein
MSVDLDRLRSMTLSHDDIYTKMAIAFDDFLLAMHRGGIPNVTEPCCVRGFWHLGAAIEFRRKADVLEMKHLMEIAHPEGIAGKPIPGPMNAPAFAALLQAHTNPIAHPVYRRNLVNLLIRTFRIPAGAEETVVGANSEAAVDAAFGNPLTAAREAIHASIPAAGVEAPPAVAGGAAAATCVESPALAELVAREIPAQPDKAFREARKKFVMHMIEAIRMIQESCRPPVELAAAYDRIIRFEPAVKPKREDPARAAFDAKSKKAANANLAVFESLRPPFSKTGGLRDAEDGLRDFDRKLRELEGLVKKAEGDLAVVKAKKVLAAIAIATTTLESVTASRDTAVASRLAVVERVDLEKRMAALADFFGKEIGDTKRRELIFGPHFGYFYLLNEQLADVGHYIATVEAARAEAAASRASVAASHAGAAASHAGAAASHAVTAASERTAANAAELAAALAIRAERNAQNAANRANPFKPGFYPKFIKADSTLPNGTPVTKDLVLARKGNTRAGHGNPKGWVFPGEHGIPLEGGRRRTRRQHRRARKTHRNH